MCRLFTLIPYLTTVPIDHITQGQRRGFATDLHGLHFPRVERFRRHRRSCPDQVEIGQFAGGSQAEAQFARIVVILQLRGETDQREDERETVGLDPQGIIHFFSLARQFELVIDTALGGSDDVDAENVFQRPARLDRIGKLAHGLVDDLAALGHFVVNHVQKALT